MGAGPAPDPAVRLRGYAALGQGFRGGQWGKKKKPWRYRWPNAVHDEVLARLLELNAERAKEEVRSGATGGKKPRKKPAAKPRAADRPPTLFD